MNQEKEASHPIPGLVNVVELRLGQGWGQAARAKGGPHPQTLPAGRQALQH